MRIDCPEGAGCGAAWSGGAICTAGALDSRPLLETGELAAAGARSCDCVPGFCVCCPAGPPYTRIWRSKNDSLGCGWGVPDGCCVDTSGVLRCTCGIEPGCVCW